MLKELRAIKTRKEWNDYLRAIAQYLVERGVSFKRFDKMGFPGGKKAARELLS